MCVCIIDTLYQIYVYKSTNVRFRVHLPQTHNQFIEERFFFLAFKPFNDDFVTSQNCSLYFVLVKVQRLLHIFLPDFRSIVFSISSESIISFEYKIIILKLHENPFDVLFTIIMRFVLKYTVSFCAFSLLKLVWVYALTMDTLALSTRTIKLANVENLLNDLKLIENSAMVD